MTETQAVRVAKGSAYLATQSFVTLTLGAVAFAFIARILTTQQMGVTVALTLTLGVAQLLSDLGFSSGLAKYIAEYRGRNEDYSPVSFAGILTKAFTATFAAVFCFVTAPLLSMLLLKSGDYAYLFRLLSFDIFLFSFSITLNYLFLGVNRIREMALVNVIGSLTRQISAVSLLLWGFGLTGLVVGWTLGDLAYTALSVGLVLKGRHVRMCTIKVAVPHLRALARFSWPLFLSSVVMFLYNWFDRAILLAYTSLSDVAVYDAALKAFGVLSAIPVALGNTLLPYFSEQYGQNKHENIAKGVPTSTRYIALFFTPLALGLMVTANPTITLFAGPLYESGDVILSILSFAGALTSVNAAFGVLLLVYEMTPIVLWIQLVSVGASLASSPILLPLLGARGMAVVRGLAIVMSFVLTTLTLKRRGLVRFDVAAIWKSWSASVIMLLVVGLAEYLFFSRYLLLFYVFLGGVAYLIALRALKAVNESDIYLIRSLLGKRGSFIGNLLEKVLT